MKICLILLLCVSASLREGVAADIKRPNIVVIYTDDQGYGDMSALNPKSKIQTPNLDRLAHEGMKFTDGHCSDTVCTPSRYSLLTGRYSWRTSLKSGVLHAEGTCLIAKDRMTVATMDLPATCAYILGVKLPDNAGEDSYSLLSAMRDDDYPRPLRGPLIHHSGSGYFAIRDGQWKLNFIRGSGGSLKPALVEPKSGEPPFELYDMKGDWRETTNVYAQHPDVVERLKAVATRIVRDDRSTPGIAQINDGTPIWPELTWIPEATELKKVKRKGKDDE